MSPVKLVYMENSRALGESSVNDLMVVVREYDEERDKAAVEEMERRCEIGQKGKPSLVTNLLGDPIGRIRQFPSHCMLVAEYGGYKEIVGAIRACVKTVTTGNSSVCMKIAYILGLRVSPTHWRLGIGTKLVQQIEKWCKLQGAEYSYMATDCGNQRSINLFTKKCSYTKFRSLTVLVQPVHAHRKPVKSGIDIVKLNPRLAGTIYRRLFAGSEFFPKDIDAILSNKLNLGTFMAVPKNGVTRWDHKILSTGQNISCTKSFAILSVWNTKEVFGLQVKGVSKLKRAYCTGMRWLDASMPWLRFPSFPDLFRQFGVYFLYGLHVEGKGASRLMKTLCTFAHNMAMDDPGCGVIVAEVAHSDPLKEVIPCWRKLSWDEDVWCIKRLDGEDSRQDRGEERFGPLDSLTTTTRPLSPPVIFVDPRDF